ncbi:MAG: cytochrome c peroxidase [Planctomycetota bacterium]
MNKRIALLGLAAMLPVVGVSFASCCGCDSDSRHGEAACPPTPLSKEQILQEDEGHARQDHQALATNLAATQRATERVLAASPAIGQGDPAAREARRLEEGASAIVTGLDAIVKDRKAAIALGKALFWDVRVGSDGQTACATCHYSAGADARNKDLDQRVSIGVAPRLFTGVTPGVALESAKPLSVAAGIEFLQKQWPSLSDRLAEVRALEQAARDAQKQQEEQTARAENRQPNPEVGEDPYVLGFAERQRTNKNSPTVVNAALFDRLFHDGRARSVFNGYDETGDDGQADPIGKFRCVDGRLERVLVRLPHAALASQATVPAMSFVEMSWFGRRFYHLGRKLLPMRPLEGQKIEGDDSVLGDYRDVASYREWLELAFRSEWLSDAVVPEPRLREGTDGSIPTIHAVEANFSLLWGIAVMLYEETLVSDQSPYDLGTLDERQRQGLQLFRQHGCVDCHLEPEFSAATKSHLYGPLTEMEDPDDTFEVAEGNGFVRWLRAGQPAIDERAEVMPVPLAEQQRGAAIDRLTVAYDNGFYDVGFGDAKRVAGVGADLVGKVMGGGAEVFELDAAARANYFAPLRMMSATFGGQGDLAPMMDRCVDYLKAKGPYASQTLDRAFAPRSFAQRQHPYGPLWIRATVKAPTLRNVALTEPYASDELREPGDLSTRVALGALATTIGLYRNPPFRDNPNLHPEVPIELTDEEIGLIVAFLKGLSDSRVDNASAPFDHPWLRVPMVREVEPNGTTGTADDHWKRIGATGRGGKLVAR